MSNRHTSPTKVARSPASRLGYLPALDGVRGVAILIVLSAHTIAWPTGRLGVDLFFVLSGFLITTLLMQEWKATGTINLRGFFRRRALRLLPALAAGLMAFLVLSAFFAAFGPSDYPSFTKSLAGAALGASYVINIIQAAGYEVPRGLLHLWSLATEEQFYLIWPVVLVVALRARVRVGFMAVALGGVAALIAVNRFHLSHEGADWFRLIAGPDVRFDALLIGCLFGLVLTAGLPGPFGIAAVRRWGRRAGALVIASCVLLTTSDTDALVEWLIVAFNLSGGLVILSLAVDRETRTSRFLSRPWLVRFGRISYGLYVWHMIVMWTPPSWGYFPLPLGVPLSIMAAELSYKYIELPFLRRKRTPAARAETQPPAVHKARPRATGVVRAPAVGGG
jgi:peptidoglycan/LPS O-acetylase OafA/YrhL